MPNRQCAVTGPRRERETLPLGTPEFIRVWCRAYTAQPVRHLEFCGWPVAYVEGEDVALEVFYTTAETLVTTVYRELELARPQGPGDLWASFGAEHDTLDGAREWLSAMTPHQARELVVGVLDVAAAKVGLAVNT
jgi:hypothetical protein